MSTTHCPREPEVLRAVAGGWRRADAGGLASHVQACARCAEVRDAAELLRAEHARTVQAARVPTSAAMWWRLERRLAAEEARRVQRLTMAIQAVVLAAAVGVGVAALQIAAAWLPVPADLATGAWYAGMRWLTAWSQAAPAWTLAIAIVACAWVLLVPAVIYIGLADD